MNLTAAQHLAVAHRDGDLLVSASAGSGKTEVLTRRCLELISDPREPCPLDRLLVLTFTRAAAAELRSRIARMLRQRSRAEDDARLRDHLRRQEVLIDTAEIGTIDAWCQRLVREHFAASPAGVDPAFTVLSAEQAVILRQQVLDELLEWVYTADDALAAEGRAWLAAQARPGDDFLRKLITALSAFRYHLVNPEQWLAAQLAVHQAEPERVQAAMQAALAGALAAECAFQISELRPLLALLSSDAARRRLEHYGQRLEAWAAALDDPGRLLEVAEEIGSYRFGRLKTAERQSLSESDQAVSEEVKARWYESRLKKAWPADVVSGVLENAGHSARRVLTLIRLEERCQQMLMRAKRARASYEFGDVQRMALDLLGVPGDGQSRRPTPLAERLRRRYRYVLVDEFQDTSPVQVELLRLVARPQPGNRFMVGDVKQSIYGFRHAEPRLFARLAEHFEQHPERGRVHHLADSFRSHPHLVEAANRLFAQLFDPRLGGTAYDERQYLVARRAELPNPSLDGSPRVELHAVLDDIDQHADESDESVPLERIEREARVVAERIRAMLDGGATVLDRDADGQPRLRPLALDDIVVLLRVARGNAALLAQALRRCGVPAVATGRETLLDCAEVRDLRELLRLLTNRRLDISLAAYLRGPLVGLEPADLWRIRQASGDGDLLDAVEAFVTGSGGDPLARRLDEALARLDQWSVAARTRDVAGLLRQIMREGGLLEFARALPGGRHRVAMLEALLTAADDFAAGKAASAADFVEYLDALEAEDVQPEATAGLAGGAVRVMTIHASKGLEFPVVFVCNTGAAFSRRPAGGSLLCDLDSLPADAPAIGLETFDYPRRTRLTTAAMLINRQQRRQRELEEELRLLYVAATRAREKLIVVGHIAPERWQACRARFAAGGALPLISRLAAPCVLEWLAMATFASGADAGEEPLIAVHTPSAGDLEAREPGAAQADSQPPDHTAAQAAAPPWLGACVELITAEPGAAALRPAVVSVSEVKHEAARGAAGDRATPLLADARLARPAFVSQQQVDGLTVGQAYHRFLQYADLSALDSVAAVRRQLDELRQAGLLDATQAACVDPGDLVWLAQSEPGRLLAAHQAACRRELPFVFGLPADDDVVLLRGIIDCVCPTPEGLLLIDYKTDRPRDEADFRQRLAGYRVQLQLYAHVAGRLLGEPVCRAALAFVCLRRMETVDVGPAALEAALGRVTALAPVG